MQDRFQALLQVALPTINFTKKKSKINTVTISKVNSNYNKKYKKLIFAIATEF